MYFIYQLCIILHVLSILASGLSRSKGATVQQPGTALFLRYAATVVAIVAWVYLPEPKGTVGSLVEDGKPEPRLVSQDSVLASMTKWLWSEMPEHERL